MKGLLYKEWATLTSSYKQTVFFIAFLYGGISILTGQTGMAYALLVLFSILITSTISFDENSHWDIYARTLPVTPAQLVGSKYLFGLCGLALGTVCTVLIVALNNVLPPLLFWHTSYKVPPLECLAALLACGSMALLLVALLLPLSYRFNSVKARSWLFLIIGVLGGCIGLVASVSPDLMQLFNASDEVLLTGLVAAFVGLLAARRNIHMDYGILGSSDLDQTSPLAAKLQTNLLLPLLYPVIRDGKIKSRLLQKRLEKRKSEMGGYVQAFMEMLGGARLYVTMQSCKNQFYSDLVTPLPDKIDVPGTEIHIFYALKMGKKYRARYEQHFARPVIHEQDLQHEELLACYPERWAQLVKDIMEGKQ